MGYWEELPDQCPPAAATDAPIELAYRIVFADPPKPEHFRSNRFLNRPLRLGSDECRHASCSLWTSKGKARTIAALPKVRAKKPYIAAVTVAAKCGKWIAKKEHIDLWIFEDFDPVGAVLEVEAV